MNKNDVTFLKKVTKHESYYLKTANKIIAQDATHLEKVFGSFFKKNNAFILSITRISA